MGIAVMLPQNLTDSVQKERLFHYICLHILLIFFNHWMCHALDLLSIYMDRESRIWYIKESIQSEKKIFFISIQQVHQQALSSSNIKSGFTATGLIPFFPERVLSKLNIQHKTPTPPSTSDSNQSFGAGKTPANIYQLEKQKKKIKSLKNIVSPSIVDEAMEKVVKGAEMTMQNTLLMQQQIHQLQSENHNRKGRKKRTKHFIQNGGSLTVADVRQQEEEQRRELERDAQPRPRRPPTCSDCGVIGHKRYQCSSR